MRWTCGRRSARCCGRSPARRAATSWTSTSRSPTSCLPSTARPAGPSRSASPLSSPTLAAACGCTAATPREQPEIDCNFLASERDARRILEGVKLARRIGRHPALARFLELEILPGVAVGDDQLPEAIASNLASYGHPTATAPVGGPRDPWAVVDSRGAVKGVDGLRVVDASIMPGVPSVALNPTTIMIAELIAKTVYAAGPGPGAREVQWA